MKHSDPSTCRPCARAHYLCTSVTWILGVTVVTDVTDVPFLYKEPSGLSCPVLVTSHHTDSLISSSPLTLHTPRLAEMTARFMQTWELTHETVTGSHIPQSLAAGFPR